MTLTEFLLQRLAEDEEFVRAGLRLRETVSHDGLSPRQEAHAGNLLNMVLDDPELVRMVAAFARSGVRAPMEAERVLAECEAKRAIVERHSNSGNDGCYICAEYERESVVCAEQRILAHVYRDHPDFDPSWLT